MKSLGTLNLFHGLSITKKLLIVFTITLVGFLLIGAAYFAVVQVEKNAVEKTASLNAFGQLVDGVNAELLTAQRLQKEFRVSRRLQELETFDNTMNEVRDKLATLGKQVPSQEIGQTLEQLRGLAESYYTLFYEAASSQLAVGLDRRTGLQGDLLKAANELESRVNKIGNAALYQSLLKILGYEKDFLLSEAEQYTTRMAAEQQAFAKLLKAAKLPAARKAKINDLMLGYYKRFRQMVDGINQLRANQHKAVDAAEAMLPVLYQAVNTTKSLLVDNESQIAVQRTQLSIVLVSILLLTAALTGGALFFLARGIIGNLRHLQKTIQEVADGNTDARAHLSSGDELGQLADVFDNLLDERVTRMAEAEKENERLNNSIIELIRAVAQISQKDFTVKAPVTEDVTGAIGDALNLLTTETSDILQQVTQVSREVSAASRKAKTISDTVTTITNNERLKVQKSFQELEVSANRMNQIAEMAQTASSTADKAIQTTETARETVTSTVTGINTIRDTIRETEKRLKRLGDRSQEITGVVNLINNIAERTHILALNASMHAASAGEAGRGFAVVADEVQRLAENAREATSEIATLVNNIRVETADTVTTMNTVISQVADGTRLAQEAGERMQSTQLATTELVESVQKIAAESSAQARLSNELREQAREIEASTQETSKGMKMQAAQTNRLVLFAAKLVQAVAVFNLPQQAVTSDSDSISAVAENADKNLPETPMREAI